MQKKECFKNKAVINWVNILSSAQSCWNIHLATYIWPHGYPTRISKTKIESSLNLPTFNLSWNSFDSTSKIYTEFNHFPPCPYYSSHLRNSYYHLTNCNSCTNSLHIYISLWFMLNIELSGINAIQLMSLISSQNKSYTTSFPTALPLIVSSLATLPVLEHVRQPYTSKLKKIHISYRRQISTWKAVHHH